MQHDDLSAQSHLSIVPIACHGSSFALTFTDLYDAWLCFDIGIYIIPLLTVSTEGSQH
jgi:hypothetical protein